MSLIILFKILKLRAEQQIKENIKKRLNLHTLSENTNMPVQTPNLKTLVPILNGIEPNFSPVTFDLITQQINLFSQQFTENKKESSGTIIYLTGFNYTQETSNINNLWVMILLFQIS